MPNNLPVKQHQQKLAFAASNNHSMPYISAFMMKNLTGREIQKTGHKVKPQDVACCTLHHGHGRPRTCKIIQSSDLIM